MPIGYASEQNLDMPINKERDRKGFDKELLEDMRLSLVQFKTEWNGACEIVSMIYEDLAKSYTGLANFFTINVDEEVLLGKEYGVTEFPTILFFRSGAVIDYAVGLVPKNVLISKIENALTPSKY